MSRPPDELLTVRQAAARYKVHPETLRSWVRKGVLAYVRVGPYGAIRLRAADLERTVTPEDQEAPCPEKR